MYLAATAAQFRQNWPFLFHSQFAVDGFARVEPGICMPIARFPERKAKLAEKSEEKSGKEGPEKMEQFRRVRDWHFNGGTSIVWPQPISQHYRNQLDKMCVEQIAKQIEIHLIGDSKKFWRNCFCFLFLCGYLNYHLAL